MFFITDNDGLLNLFESKIELQEDFINICLEYLNYLSLEKDRAIFHNSKIDDCFQTVLEIWYGHNFKTIEHGGYTTVHSAKILSPEDFFIEKGYFKKLRHIILYTDMP